MTSGLILALAAFGVLFQGCASRYFKLKSTEVPNELTRLVHQRPEYFGSPLTLIVLLDTTPCAGQLHETIWWKDWQEAALKAGVGFVFATSTADSTDVAIAVELEGIDAPILVLPSCPRSVHSLGLEFGQLPLKLLIDRKGEAHHGWFPVSTLNQSSILMQQVDSISARTTQ